MSDSLPDELNLQIFSYLVLPRDFLAALGVCRLWRRLMADPAISRAPGEHDLDKGFPVEAALSLAQHHPGIRIHVNVNAAGAAQLLACDEATQLQLVQATERLSINPGTLADGGVDLPTERHIVSLFLAPRGTVRRFRGSLPEPEQCAAFTHLQNAALSGNKDDELERLASAARFPALRILLSQRGERSFRATPPVEPAPHLEELLSYKRSDTTPLLAQFPNLRRLNLYWSKAHSLRPLAQQLTHLMVLLYKATLAELVPSGPFSALLALTVKAPDSSPFTREELRALETIVRDAPRLRTLHLRLDVEHGGRDITVLAPAISSLLIETHLEEMTLVFPYRALQEVMRPVLAALCATLFPADAATATRDDAIDWQQFWSQARVDRLEYDLLYDFGADVEHGTHFVGRWTWHGVVWQVYAVVDAFPDRQSEGLFAWVKINLRRCMWPHA